MPPAALREALVNAGVHADYAQPGAPIRVAVFDDRVEVENPGVLLAGLTIEDIREGVSRVRNRVMARVFHELGLVEQWGTGVLRMVASCVEAGLPEPEFAELGLRFRVTIRTDRSAAPALDRLDDRIVSCLRAEGGRSTAEIAVRVGLSARSVQHRLASLAERGVVVAAGTFLGGVSRTLAARAPDSQRRGGRGARHSFGTWPRARGPLGHPFAYPEPSWSGRGRTRRSASR